MQRRIAEVTARLPWLVCERAGGIAGYAYATPHRTRAAYQWSVETSAYVHAGARRSGVARALYGALLALLEVQGYRNAYAIITLPNPASVALHEALGFRSVGVHRGAGYKLGAWHDVGWWQRALAARTRDPGPPLAAEAAHSLPEWERALRAGSASLARGPSSPPRG
jgi:phosphinothricin acetyltransferase